MRTISTFLQGSQTELGLILNPDATFVRKHKEAKIFENHLNPVMLVFIGKLSLSTLRWVPICQGFSHFLGLLQHFVLAKLSTSSIRVNVA